MKILKLWDAPKLNCETLAFPGIITDVLVHRSAAPYEFLLGADVIEFDGELFCGWGASRKDENDCFSVMNGAVSKDALLWNEKMRISPLPRGKKAYSHGVFHVENGELYAYVPNASYNIFTYDDIQTIKMIWNKEKREWEYVGLAIPEHFWPMSRPVDNGNGAWLMPGLLLDKRGAYPTVAFRLKNTAEKWEIRRIPVPGRKGLWGEGGLLVKGNEVLYIFRNGWDQKRVACAAVSTDHGYSWHESCQTNFPMSLAKPCCGMLPDSRNYIICNMPCKKYEERDTLVLALSRPGEWVFDRAWALRRGSSPLPRRKGIGKSPQWAYPLACVRDNTLCVVYSSSKEDCAASLIPLECLK